MKSSESREQIGSKPMRRLIQPINEALGASHQQQPCHRRILNDRLLLSTHEMEDEDRYNLVPNNISSEVYSHHSVTPNRTVTEPTECTPGRTPEVQMRGAQHELQLKSSSSTRIIDVRRLKKSIESRNIQQLTAKRDISTNKFRDVGALVSSNKELKEKSVGKQPHFDNNRTGLVDIWKQPTAESVSEHQMQLRQNTQFVRAAPTRAEQHNHNHGASSKCWRGCGDEQPSPPKKVAMPKRLPNLRCLAIQKRAVRIVTPAPFNERLEKDKSSKRSMSIHRQPQLSAKQLARTHNH